MWQNMMKEYNDRQKINEAPVLSSLSLFLRPEDGGRKFLRNAGKRSIRLHGVTFEKSQLCPSESPANLGHEKEKCSIISGGRG
jgi:hypothetical protein